MVLNKLRQSLEPALYFASQKLSRAGLTPNYLTVSGFLLSMLAGFLYALRPSQPYLAGVVLIFGGLLDILDGSVARVSDRVTKFGSFNDSTLDRLAEISIYGGIAWGREAPAFATILALGLSLLVSYMRAKGEALNTCISGLGVGERAERLIALIVSSLVGFVWLGVYAVIVLAAVTIVHRYYHVSSAIAVRH